MLHEAFKRLPSNQLLIQIINQILHGEESGSYDVFLLKRGKNLYSSTHPSEIVTCLVNGQKTNLFLKYEIDALSKIDKRRNSLDYEIKVYRHILHHSSLSTPRYLGSYGSGHNGTKVLALEYLEDHAMFQQSENPNAIFLAAQWLGKFHRRSVLFIDTPKAAFLKRYDIYFFRQWSNQIRSLVIQSPNPHNQWILNLISAFERQLPKMISRNQVIIHGEFYPQNVSYANERIYPLDWQTAAIGAGEIDFAALAQGWPEEVKIKCLQEYLQSSQLKESIHTIKERILLAEVFFNFVWLLDKPEIIEIGGAIIDNLKNLAERIS